MEITKLIEENKTLLRLGLCFDVPDARVRITERLQKNNDRSKLLNNLCMNCLKLAVFTYRKYSTKHF